MVAGDIHWPWKLLCGTNNGFMLRKLTYRSIRTERTLSFPLQKWSRERLTMFRYACITCLCI